MPDLVTLRDIDGRAVGVPQEQVASYIAQGFRPETSEEGVERTAAETFHDEHGGIGGALAAGALGGLSGLTLGASDLAVHALGGERAARHLEAEHPYATGAGNIAGSLAPAVLSGGESLGARILAHSPAGLAGKVGGAVSGLGEGAGLAGRLAAGTAGAAAEGALYGGGQYLTETALSDKPLSAEGFVAGMGHGAMFGAPIGAAGTLASGVLQRARSLFPRSEASAAEASGIKEQASGALAQAVRDGDAMAAAAERKLSDVDAHTQMAQSGETVTRRMFGAADPQALSDQVAGAVDRQQVTQAIDGYRRARAQFDEWATTEADHDLERALLGVQPGELQAPAIGAPPVPVGEFGAPGARGIKTPDELQRVAEGSAGDGLAPRLEQEMRALRAPQGTPAEPGEVPATEIMQRGLAGPGPAGGIPDRARVAGRYRAGQMTTSDGIPEYDAIKAHEARADDALERAVPARDIAERGYYEPPGAGADAVKVAKARAAISEGQREPIDLNITPSGKITVTGGRHRLAAAIEADAPVKVRWSSGSEPAESDVLRGGAKIAAGGGTDLEALLRGTQEGIAAGEPIAKLGASARAEYAAAKQAKTTAAAEHFREQAIAARPWNEGIQVGRGGTYETSPMAAAEREAQAEAISMRNAGGADESGIPQGLRDAVALIERDVPPRAPGAASAAEVNANRMELGLPDMLSKPPSRSTVVDKGIRDRMRAVSDEAAIAKAIMRHNGKGVDMGPSLARAGKVIGDLEDASAKLTDVLGSEAPATAVEHAGIYRALMRERHEQAAASAAKAAADLKAKAVPELDATVVDDAVAKALRQHDARAAAVAAKAAPTAAQPAAASTSVGGKLADAGAALEVLHAIGVHVPALSAIPVIGPVLGLWLKARAVMGILGRKGGSIGKSTESVIAAKAAATRDRIAAATEAILEGASKAAGKASHLAGPAVLLGDKLFPGGEKAASDNPRDLYEARVDDIVRAQTPGAVDQAISQRFPTSDPDLHDAIVAQVQRGIAFLDTKRPKQTVLPGVLPGDGTWKPSMAAIDVFGKYVHAVNDPVSVLEDLAAGHVYAEGAETLRVVYPQLYQYAQKELLQAAPEMATTLPYSRRVLISLLYQIPVDGTLRPSHAQYLQTAAPPAPAPKASTISGPLKLGQQMMQPLDQRAAGG